MSRLHLYIIYKWRVAVSGLHATLYIRISIWKCINIINACVFVRTRVNVEREKIRALADRHEKYLDRVSSYRTRERQGTIGLCSPVKGHIFRGARHRKARSNRVVDRPEASALVSTREYILQTRTRVNGSGAGLTSASAWPYKEARAAARYNTRVSCARVTIDRFGARSIDDGRACNYCAWRATSQRNDYSACTHAPVIVAFV
ncbi:unnamed protein product [Trichogramma brassicae]|uniref:Uncharacterized protein n=1 Tax=Trichogramma brassicae TaxID=86971 RepID=A0A6H5I4F8_9HYME|nr:unnamed protein product [Trichogramma brassicae]